MRVFSVVTTEPGLHCRKTKQRLTDNPLERGSSLDKFDNRSVKTNAGMKTEVAPVGSSQTNWVNVVVIEARTELLQCDDRIIGRAEAAHENIC